jgi:hypothetical protein
LQVVLGVRSATGRRRALGQRAVAEGLKAEEKLAVEHPERELLLGEKLP